MAALDSSVLDGLELLDVGIGVFDAKARLIHCNRAFRELRNYPESLCQPGTQLESMIRFNAERGDFGPGDTDAQVAERMAEIIGAGEREVEREMADGQVLRIRYRRMPTGGQVISFVDCTAERRAEAALKASEERYALVSEAAEEAIYEWDIAGKRFYASPRLRAVLGREWGEDGDRPWDWDDVVHPDDLAHYRSSLDAHLSGAVPRWSCEYRLKDASGAWRWVSDHGTSIRGEDGRAQRMIAAVRDITERVEKDAALAASEERHMLVTRATADGIYDWNVTDDLLYVSDNLIRILDFDLGIKASGMWARRVHPDDYERYVAAIRAHFRGETDALKCEYRVRGKGGEYRWIQDHGIGVRREDGRVTRMVGAVRDITEVRHARAELDRSQQLLASSLATISDGILLVDAENRVQLWNDRYFEIFTEAAGGADLSDVIVKGRPFFEMIRDGYNLGMFKPHPDGVDAWIKARAQAWAQPASQWELELANGTWILLNERTTADGGRVSVYTDITELKRREADAQAARARFADAIESISSGFALFDADDRLMVWNSRFQDYFARMSDVFIPGATFAEMMSASIERGLFPTATGNEQEFLDNLLAERARGIGKVRENRLADGLWLQITDHRTRDGGLVSIYTDVTELKTSEREAQSARARFEEAIEAISSGFVLWDAEDRLTVCNRKYREYFPELADMVTPGTSFREIMLAGIARGLFPKAEADPEAFLGAVSRKRAAASGGIREQQMAGGLWLQISDHRTADGGIVSIYTDVTELKTREAESRAASKRFEEAIEAISSGFSLWDAEDRLVVSNTRYRELYADLSDAVKPGVAMRDLLMLAATRGLIPDAKHDPEGYVAENLRKRAAGLGQIREHRLSSGLWLQITDHRTADGGIVSIHTDVTELKNRQEEIRKQSAILEATMENMGQGITMVDRNLRTVAFNKKFFELMEFPEDRFGRGFSMEEAFRYNAERGEYGPGDIEEQVRERMALARKFLPHRFERTRPDGTVLEIVGNPIEGGGLVATYTDITERKRAEEALKAALAEFNAVLDNIDYGIIFMGPDLRAKIINRAMKRQWNFPQEFVDTNPTMREMIEKNRNAGLYAVDPEDWDAWIDERIDRVRQGDIAPTEMHRADGTILSYQCVALPDGGRMLTYFDITELKRAEQVLRDSEARLRGILENSPIGVAVIRDEDNVILFHNPRFPEILRGPGENLVGTSSTRFWTDMAERERARRQFEKDGRVVNREVKYRGMDGSDIWSLSTYERAEWEGVPARLIWLFDITQEKANREALVVARDAAEAALADLQTAQARLIQAEKMASLGQLTAGIAHEIKNPLNFVNNFAKLSDELLEELSEILEKPIKALDQETRDDAEDLLHTVRENLGKINEHGKRADSIVKNMLLHSREGPSQQQTVNLNSIAEEALNLAYHGARAENPKFNIEMKKTLAAEVGTVECFPQELMRVFLNLITNGMYAANKRLTETGGRPPEIILTTRTNGDRIEVEVRDNGAGIPADLREKIFTPFFTTKPAGEGTGLGLSLSYDIVVKQHGGDLTVDSEPGEFTAFRVTLPRTLPVAGGARQ